MLAQYPLQADCECRAEYLHALPQMDRLMSEFLDARIRKIECVASSSEGAPAEIAIPILMEIRIIVLLERHATTIGSVATAGNLRVMHHRFLGDNSR